MFDRVIKPIRWTIGVSLIVLAYMIAGAAYGAEIVIDMTAPECGETIVLETDSAGVLVAGECRAAAPPPSVTGAADSALLAGCSQTWRWVGAQFADEDRNPITGFEDLYPGFFTRSPSTYSGAVIGQWAGTESDSRNRFGALMDSVRGTEDFILIQVCTINSATPQSAAADIRIAIDRFQNELASRYGMGPLPVYLQPLDVSNASSGCRYADYDASYLGIQDVVQTGEAFMGPELIPLYQAHEVTGGGMCHPSADAVDRHIPVIVDWLATEGLWTP